MSGPRRTYAGNLLAEFDGIAASYSDVIAHSTIEYVNPNRTGSRGIIFVGAADWGWAASNSDLEAARMALLRRLRGLPIATLWTTTTSPSDRPTSTTAQSSKRLRCAAIFNLPIQQQIPRGTR